MSTEDQDELDELRAEVLGPAGVWPPIIAWWPEPPNMPRALWDDSMPLDQRFRVFVEALRNGADRRTQDAIADVLDQFSRRKAGNPKRAGGTWAQVENLMIAAEAKCLCRKFLRQGQRPRGLKKRVSDEIGKRYGKKGSTIDKLWSIADAINRRPGGPNRSEVPRRSGR